MEKDIRSVKGTEYELEGLEEAFRRPESFTLDSKTEGHLYGVKDSYLRGVLNLDESDTVIYTTANKSIYFLHHWNEEKDRGLLEDTEGLKWLYDAEEDFTAYFDGERYVAAHNPDISRVWDEVISGEWMNDSGKAVDVLEGLNRLHPQVRERVRRGL